MWNKPGFVLLLTLVCYSSGCKSAKQEECDAVLRTDGSVLRSPSTGRIYLVSGQSRHYIAGPAVAEALGTACIVRTEPDPLIDEIPLGPDMPLLTTKVVRNPRTQEIFVLESGKRRYIPDTGTIEALNLGPQVRTIRETELELIPLGPPMSPQGAKK